MTNLECEQYLTETANADPKSPGLRTGLCRFLIQELLLARHALQEKFPGVQQGTIPRCRIEPRPEDFVPIRSPRFEAPSKPLTNRRIDDLAKKGHYGESARLAAEARALKTGTPTPSKETLINFLTSLGIDHKA